MAKTGISRFGPVIALPSFSCSEAQFPFVAVSLDGTAEQENTHSANFDQDV